MEHFKNLSQLESKYKIFSEGDTKFEVVFNSNHKKAIKEFKDLFKSLNFQQEVNANGTVSLLSEGISHFYLRLFSEYINKIKLEKNICLNLSTYTQEQLKQLTFSDYVEHFKSCFVFMYMDSCQDDDGDFYLHKHYTNKKYALGLAIFDSPLASPTYPQQLYSSLKNVMCKHYNTDFMIEKSVPAIDIPHSINRLTEDPLDRMIFDIINTMNHLLVNEATPEAIYGYPTDMLSSYIKSSRNRNTFSIIQPMLFSYISRKYHINKDFCVGNERRINYGNILDLSYIIEVSRKCTFGPHDNFSFNLGDPESFNSDIYDKFEEFIYQISSYVWNALNLHHTFKHLNTAYNLARKENKTLFTLTQEKNYVNKPMGEAEAIKHLVQALHITQENSTTEMWEMIQERMIDNSDVQYDDDGLISDEEAEREIKDLDN